MADEKRQVFDIMELRLSYTCEGCKTEFIFADAKSVQWGFCPVCNDELRMANPNRPIPTFCSGTQ